MEYEQDGTRIDSQLSIWPRVTTESTHLILWVPRPLYDLTSGTDNIDFPQEWFLAISYNLAKYIMKKYGLEISVEKLQELLEENFTDLGRFETTYYISYDGY